MFVEIDILCKHKAKNPMEILPTSRYLPDKNGRVFDSLSFVLRFGYIAKKIS